MSPDEARPLDPILASGPAHDSDNVAIAPSKPLPAEHPSAPPTPRAPGHTPKQSSDPVSPRTVIHEKRPSDPTQSKDARRAQSVSFSIPVLPNNGYDHRRTTSNSTATQNNSAAAALVANSRPQNALKISIPPAGDLNFLTALASQERQVLELKEHLSKAEDELSRLKRLWVSQEAKKRQSEARGLHRMTSTSSNTKVTSLSAGAGPPSVESMYEEMARRKATLSETGMVASTPGERPPRRRFFSGSRQLRTLSLVSPPPITEDAEDSESEPLERARPDSDLQLEGILGSPNQQLPPTPDLIEEEEDTDPSTSSTRSSRSPGRERMMRSSMRTSMQMAADFREGLWTFFEDLKQATVGEDARGPEVHSPGFSDKEVVSPLSSRKDSPLSSRKDSPLSSRKDSPNDGTRPKKQTVRRQTWQFRPSDTPSTAPLIDSNNFWKEQGIAEVDEPERPAKPLKKQRSFNALSATPKLALREEEHEGEVWNTWDSPKRGPSPARSKSATPVPPPTMNEGRKASHLSIDPAKSRKTSHAEVTGYRKSATTAGDRISDPSSRTHNKEHFRRDSMAWPASAVLDRFRPGQLRQGVNSLLDDWERSLSPPGQPKATGLRPADTTRASSPGPGRPVSQRTNSRLDAVYQ